MAYTIEVPVDWLYAGKRIYINVVSDGFMGVGSTSVACKELGRDFVGCEIDDGYFEIAERRLT